MRQALNYSGQSCCGDWFWFGDMPDTDTDTDTDTDDGATYAMVRMQVVDQ
jgi:hypothetical protein